MHPICHARKHRQLASHRAPGWGLLDALIALTVLSLGVLVLTRLQTRLLIDGRSAIHRATAIHLIHDIHNRMLLNRTAAQAAAYALRWQQRPVHVACDATPCNATQRAQSDLNLWAHTVRTTLPDGRARIFHAPDNPRQIGVMVAWAHQDTITLPDTANANACPSDMLCHVVYVEI